MIKLEAIELSCNGRRIDFHYTASGKTEKFFANAERFYVEYPVDVSSCPASLLAVPFVSNFEPIAWFAGCELTVPELDAQFMASRGPYRECFSRMFAGHKLTGAVKPQRLVENSITGDLSLMLYSGGMDAATTLARNYSRSLALVLVRGADVDVSDEPRWAELNSHVRSQEITQGRPVLTVTTNARKFYNDLVRTRLYHDWWGKVQHGGALIGTLAPLNHALRATTNIISSSYNIPMTWGSTKEADELLRWAGVSCVHDAAEISRQHKAKYLVEWRRSTGIDVKLRVCYSKIEPHGNCGRCEKCYRTIMNLVLCGADPREYGLPMDAGTYGNLTRLMLSKDGSVGLIKFWTEISDEARAALSDGSFFVADDLEHEKAFISLVASGKFVRALRRNHSRRRHLLALSKLWIRTELPRLHSALLGARCAFGKAVGWFRPSAGARR
jgi:hypothetical protein